jgi:hypothetical protein
MAYRVGQTATNPKTGQKVQWDGSNWVSIQGPTAGAGRGMSPTAQKFLNELSTEAAAANETSRFYDRAKNAVSTLKPGPYRGTFLDMAIPTENGGFFDKLGAVLIGGPARVTGAITPKEVDAYQTLRGLQSEQVLGKQLLQKGPQTESDAARLQLTEISPQKSTATNEQVIAQGQRKAKRVQAKSIFYSRWANKYGGPNQANPEGMTADEVWNKSADYITDRLFPPTGSGPTIRVLSRTKAK